MTRENKLALVIGFALILFVGVLVSDHFSAATNDRAADFSTRDRSLVASRDARIFELVPLTHPGTPSQGPADHDGARPNEPSQARTDPPPSSPMPVLDTEQALADEFRMVPMPNETPVERITLGGMERRFADGQEPSIFHDVQKGQTLYSICRQHYGSAALMKELARYNGIGDPTSLAAGRRLRIPSQDVLGGRPSPANSEPTITPAPVAATARFETYTVKPSDTLTRIARKVLGSPARVHELIELNDDMLDDPDHLRVGARIRVPAVAMRAGR